MFKENYLCYPSRRIRKAGNSSTFLISLNPCQVKTLFVLMTETVENNRAYIQSIHAAL